jgi:drug/metabolite transporter (DMT)-like permease
MREKGPNHALLALSLLFAVFLWGGNNVGTKFIVATWPPVWTGASRFLCAGLLLLAILKLSGKHHASSNTDLQRKLWLRGGLGLAVYITSFNFALKYTAASHVAVYLGAAPVWALLWEGSPRKELDSLHRYGAAILALTGVVVLFWEALTTTRGFWLGEVLGLLASILWTNYGRQCKLLAGEIPATRVTASTMWRAGVLLMPLAIIEVASHPLQWRWDVVGVQLYCIVAGGVVAFLIWNNALRHWRTSQVLLFNNLIPLSTALWAATFLNEKIGPRFWVAVALVVAGVALGQTNRVKPPTKGPNPPPVRPTLTPEV